MSISFSGLASGLDTSSWIKQLTELRQAKVTTLQNEKIGIQALSVKVSGIKSCFNTFRASLEKVTDAKFNVASMNVFAQNIATASKVNVLSATATAEAKEATYEISVSQLASKTRAESKATYNTTRTETTIADTDTKLTDLGVHTGVISVDGESVTIDSDTTIGTFASKIRSLGNGLDAFYNEYTGVFVTNVTSGMIDDTVDNTEIVQKLHLSDIAQGYRSSSTLNYSVEETSYANVNTSLSTYGVSSGNLALTKGFETKNITVEEDDTIQDLIDKLGADGVGIIAEMRDGVFSIKNAAIVTDPTKTTTNLATKLGMTEDAVSSVYGRSGELTYSTTEVTTTLAALTDTLEDLGADAFTNHTVELKFSDGTSETVTINSSDTIETVIGNLNTAGATAGYDEATGVFSLENCYITTNLENDNTFDIAGFFNLSSSNVTMSSNVHLQKYSAGTVATSSTTFEQLGLTSAQSLILGCSDGTNATLTVSTTTDSHSTTLEDVFNQLSNDYHINASINNGVMSFENNEYDNKTYYISGGTFAEHFGISTDVDNTTIVTESTGTAFSVTTNQDADTTTTLEELGITDYVIDIKDDDGRCIKDSENNDLTYTFNSASTIGDIITAVNGADAGVTLGISNGVFTLSNDSGVHLAGSLAQRIGITENIIAGENITTGMAMTSFEPVTYNTVKVANSDTVLGDLGLNNLDIIVKENGRPDTEIAYSLSAGATDSLGSIFAELSSNGVNININNGVLSINSPSGRYIDGECSFATAFHITENGGSIAEATAGVSSTSSQSVTETITHAIDTTTTLQTALTNPDITTYSLVIMSTDPSVVTPEATLTYDKTTATFGDVISDLNTTYGFDIAISESGRFTFNSVNSDFYIDPNSNLANALGITCQTAIEHITVSNSVTSSESITYSTVATASTSTSLQQLGISDGAVLSVMGNNGDTICSYTYNSSTTLDTVLQNINANGMNATLENGVINVSSVNNNGRYISGTLAESLGIETEYTTTGSNILLGSVTPVNTSGMDVVPPVPDNIVNTTGMWSLTEASELSELNGFISDVEMFSDPDAVEFTKMQPFTPVGTSGLERIASAISGADVSDAVNMSNVVYAPQLSRVDTGTTLTGTYAISTTDDLLALSQATQDGNVDSSAVFIMTDDIDMDGIGNFTPIGAESNAFCGTFNGNGHVISNLRLIDDSGDEGALVGLFGKINGGTVENLGMENIYLQSTSGYVGGIAANVCDNAEIANCYVTGNIEGGDCVGGLVGQAVGLVVKDVYTNVNMTYSFTNKVGGIVGENCGALSILNSQVDGILSNSEFGLFVGEKVGGEITFYHCEAYNNDISGCSVIGGEDGVPEQVAVNSGSSTHSGFVENPLQTVVVNNTSSLSGTYTISSTSDLECLAQYSSMDMIDSSAVFVLADDIDMSGVTNFTPIVNFSGTFDGNNHVIRNLTINQAATSGVGLFAELDSSCTIKNLGLENVDITGESSVGGIAGSASGAEILNCYVTGEINSESSNVGGIAGAASSTSITNCYYTGGITGVEKVGGIVGRADNATVSSCYTNATMSGDSNVGGIVGSMFNSCSITSCCVLGTVDEEASGGIISGEYDSGSVIENCKYVNDSNHAVVNGGSVSDSNVAVNSASELYDTTHYDGNFMAMVRDCANADAITSGIYTISGLADLNYLAEMTNAGKIGSDVTFVLNQDINLTGTNYTPIGNSTNAFSATFEGNGHKILGLAGESGIFGCVDGGTINNLGIEGAHIADGTESGYTGILANQVTDAVINNCYTTGCIEINESNGNSFGGLVGLAENSEFADCFSGAEITGNIQLSDIIGGLVGKSHATSYSGCTGYGFINGGSHCMGALCGVSLDDTYIDCMYAVKAGVMNECGNRTGVAQRLTLSDSYNITNTADFQLFANLCKYNTLEGDCKITFQSDLDMSGIKSYSAFGINNIQIYGNGHKIQNLSSSSALFNVANHSVVNDLGLENVNFSGPTVAGLILTAEQTDINNCYVTGNIIGSNAAGLVYDATDSNINDAYFRGNIKIPTSGYGTAAGLVLGGNASASGCFFDGKITDDLYGTDLSAQNCFGSSSIMVENCYSTTSTVAGAGISVIDGNHISGNFAISSAEDLVALANIYNSPDYSGNIGECNFYMTNNIDMSGVEHFESIDNFTGVFDGNGYKISKLTSTGGLFGGINGTIKNLGLENVSINGNRNIGGLVNELLVGGEIQNCYVTGNITGVGETGGIVGTMVDLTSVKNSYFNGDITLSLDLSPGQCFGGIVGRINGEATAIVENCYSSVTMGNYASSALMGALVGVTNCSDNIKNCGYLSSECHAYGDENDSVGQNIQRLSVGFEFDEITHLNGDFCTYINAEPLSGNYKISTSDDLVKFSKLVNAGLVSDSTNFTLENDIDMSGVTDFIPIGKYTAFTGNFDGNGHTISNLTIDSEMNNVGLFGTAEDGVICNLGLVNVDISGATNVGGILGCGIRSHITNCYVSGGTITGAENVGGIAGYLDQAELDYAYTNVTMDSCGSASGLGGIVGTTQNSQYNECYVLGGFENITGNPEIEEGVFYGKEDIGYNNNFIHCGYSKENEIEPVSEQEGITEYNTINDLSQHTGARFFNSPIINTPTSMLNFDTVAPVNTSTLLSDLNLTGSYTITKHTTDGTVLGVFNGNHTIGEIAQFADAFLTNDSILRIENGSSSYITSMPDELKTALHFDDDTQFCHDISSYTPVNFNGRDVSYETQSAITETTKFGDLHLVGSATVSAVGTNSGTFTIDSNTTVGQLGNWLEDDIQGISFSIDEPTGKVTITPTANCYVDMPDNVRVALGNMGATYTTSVVGDITNSISTDTLSYTQTNTMTESSTFGQLGVTDDTTVYINNNGEYASITVGSTTTVSTFMNWIRANGASHSSVENGVVNIQFDTGSFFEISGDYALDNDIKNALKINPSYTSDSTQVITNNNANTRFTTSVETTLSTLTQLGDIEGFTPSTLTISRTGQADSHIYLDSSKTLGSFFSELGEKGITASITQSSASDGNKIQLVYDGNTQISGDISFLNLTEESENVTTDYNTSNSDSVQGRSLINAQVSTKLGELIHNDYSVLGNENSSYTLTVSGTGSSSSGTAVFDNDSNLRDVFNWLDTKGIQASIDSTGKISLNSDNEFSISGTPLFDFIMGVPLKQADYTGLEEIVNTNTHDCSATEDTRLADIGITSGEFFIVNRNGANEVRTVVGVDNNKTIGELFDTLRQFNISATLDSNSRIVIEGMGDISLQGSSSNIVSELFNNEFVYSGSYSSDVLNVNATSSYTADENTLLSEFDTPSKKSEGVLSLVVNGSSKYINIAHDETFGSLIEKFSNVGVNASLVDGKLTLNSPVDFTVGQTCTSKLYENLRLGGEITGMASNEELTTSRVYEETVVGSAVMGADESTVLKTLGVTSGTFIMYKNGQKMSINVDEDETFQNLADKIKTASGNTVDIKFDNGYLIIDSSTPLTELKLGTAVNNASNFVSVCGLSSGENGEIKSSRPLYKVNGNTRLMESGIFRNADGKKIDGEFEIGNATFKIDENTTINSLISAINSTEDSLATAYWDSLAGNFVITSRVSGESLINIKALDSDFTDILGYTKTYRDADGNITNWQINTSAQELGKQAVFTINGNRMTNNSNTITSDVSHIDGVTINLKDVTGDEPTTLTISRDTETAANAMQEIVDSYNELIKNVEKELSQTGDLKNQTTLKMIKNNIRNYMIGSVMSSSGFKNMSAIGISAQAASNNNISTDNLNLVTFDKEKFCELFKENPNAIQEFLVGNGSTSGVLTMMENTVEQALSSASGYFTVTENSYKKQIQTLDDKIAKAQASVNSYKARLEAKFKSMDLLISNIQDQYSSFLQT